MPAQQVMSSFDLSLTGSMIASSTSSYMASKRYVHIMLRSSLLNILYRRMHLDEKFFRTKYLDEMPFVVFKKTPKNPKDPIIADFFRWLMAIKHAIDKSYLKEIYLHMKSPAGEILESYRFRLRYNPEGDKTYQSMPEPPEVKINALRLFGVFQSLEQIEKLGNGTFPDLLLTFNEDTPDEYEPPGFMAGTQFPAFVSPIHLGTLNTGFHKVNYYGSGKLLSKLPEIINAPLENNDKNKNRAFDEETVINEEDKNETERSAGGEDLLFTGDRPDLDITTNQRRADSNTSNVTVPDLLFTGDKPDLDITTNKRRADFNTSNITVPDTNDNDVITIVSDDEEDVSMTRPDNECNYCHLKLDDIALITCTTCHRKYHGVCCGYFDLNGSMQNEFECNNCSESVESILNLPESVMENQIPKVRLLIYYAKKHGELSNRILESFSPDDRKSILKQIEDHQFFSPDKSINENVLKYFINVMFKDVKDSQFFE